MRGDGSLAGKDVLRFVQNIGGWVEFVVSHPFASKKAKGWGTECAGVGYCRA
jgi:hypothetical protein